MKISMFVPEFSHVHLEYISTSHVYIYICNGYGLFNMSPGEQPLRAAIKPRYMNYNHTIHQASEEIISQRIALKPRLYIHIIITIHPNT